MKIAGIDLGQPSDVIIPIIRGEQEVIFKAACIVNMDELDKILIEPKPPQRMMRGETVATSVFDDPKYIKEMNVFSKRRIAWMVAKSLLATDNLEWETVDLQNPETFENYETELKTGGFNEFQIGSLVRGVMEANGLSESRVQEARNRFLATQRQGLDTPSSLTVEQPNISSGDSVKDSESSPQA